MKNKKMIIVLFSLVLVLSACSLFSKPSVESAEKLAKDGKVDEATDMLEALIDEDDKNFELYLSLADVYMDDEDYRNVDRTLEDLSELIEDEFDDDDDDVLDALDDLLDFAKDLNKEGEPVGDWFVEFVETPDIMGLDLNLSKVLDTEEKDDAKVTPKDDSKDETIDDSNDTINTEDATDTDDDMSEATGFEFMSYTYADVINTFGEPNATDESLNTIELMYDDVYYTFMFPIEGLNDSTLVGLISISGSEGKIQPNEPIIGKNIYILSDDYGYDDIVYFEKTILTDGSPFAKTTDGTYAYLLFLDNNDNITDCFIQKNDYSSAMDYYAEDYLGSSLRDIKDVYGDMYYVVETETDYIIMYFGMPYYFMFENTSELTDSSLITSVSLEAGGKAISTDPLMFMSEVDFVDNYKDGYAVVEYDSEFGMAILEGYDAYALIVFDSSETPNQVIVANDLYQLGYGDIDDGFSDNYEPFYGFDYLYYTYGDLKGFIGEPTYIDDSRSTYGYLEYDNIPYDFGYDISEGLTDDSYIYTVFIYFDEGGDYYEGISYKYMTYDTFMSDEASFYTNINWFEEDLRLEFEDEFAYYYLYYTEGPNPTYMFIESK